MWKTNRPELTVIFLLVVVIWLEAKVEILVHCPFQKLDWNDARNYCREHYVDMVTGTVVDADLMDWFLAEGSYPLWVGLHEDPGQPSVWKWINIKTGDGLTGEDVSENITWGTTKPVGNCGSYNWKFYQTYCPTELQFLCFEDNLLLVTENRTWEDALSYCRSMTSSSYQYDLLSLTDPSDYSYVRDRIYRATTEEVWTGLRFLGGEWWWSDGETLDHEEMLPNCPNQWNHCGTLSTNDTNNWITRDCSENRNFICSRKEVIYRSDVEENV